jgi:hypothetical protein
VNGSGGVTGVTVSDAGSYNQSWAPYAAGGMTNLTGSMAGSGLVLTPTMVNVAGNTASGQVPASTQVTTNPNTAIWSANYTCNYSTAPALIVPSQASHSSCFELDVNNKTGVSDYLASTYQGHYRGILIGNGGSQPIANEIILGGKFLVGVAIGDSVNEALDGIVYFPPPGQSPAPTMLISKQTNGTVLTTTLASGTLVLDQTNTGLVADKWTYGGQLSIGGETASTNPFLEFYSSGSGVGDWDSAIVPSGGSGIGDGTLTFDANALVFNPAAGGGGTLTGQTNGYAFSPLGQGNVLLISSPGAGTVDYLVVTGARPATP